MVKEIMKLLKEELAKILSVRPCTVLEICTMFGCSKEEAEKTLTEVLNLKFKANYYYVGDIMSVLWKFIQNISPVFLCYVNTKTQGLLHKIDALPAYTWYWLPRKEREKELMRTFDSFEIVLTE